MPESVLYYSLDKGQYFGVEIQLELEIDEIYQKILTIALILKRLGYGHRNRTTQITGLTYI